MKFPQFQLIGAIYILFKINYFVIIHVNKILGVSNPRCKPRLSDNFFEIGGTSINAVAVVSKINESISVSIEKFIQAKTIGDLIFSKTDANGTC